MKAIDIHITSRLWIVNGENIEETAVVSIKSGGECKLNLEIQNAEITRSCYDVPYGADSFQTDMGLWVFLDKKDAIAHTFKRIEQSYLYWERRFQDAKLIIDTM